MDDDRVHLDRLQRRRDHLHRRIVAAAPITLTHDIAERDALDWALAELTAEDAAQTCESCEQPTEFFHETDDGVMLCEDCWQDLNPSS